jgi:hypothetical protein
MHVYLVGVDHGLQYSNAKYGPERLESVKKFSDYLKDQAGEMAVDTLAEEFSEEALSANGAAASVAKKVASGLGIRHLFCDPDREERTSLGVSDPNQREEIWLGRLLAAGAERVLFVCGNDHVESFQGLLVSRGDQAEVLSRDWGHEPGSMPWELRS